METRITTILSLFDVILFYFSWCFDGYGDDELYRRIFQVIEVGGRELVMGKENDGVILPFIVHVKQKIHLLMTM